MKKTELQKALAKIAPHIAIRTIWEHDQDSGPISKECDGFTPDQDDEWQAWQSNVQAVAIVDGGQIEGNAYLGGTFEKFGDVPEESNPEISGYENQKTVEALEELGQQTTDLDISNQVIAAIHHCKDLARISYEAQRAEIEANCKQ